MSLHNQEFLSELELTRFPFKDGCKLLFRRNRQSGAQVQLSESLFSFAQFTLFPAWHDVTRISLIRLVRSNLGNNISYRFDFAVMAGAQLKQTIQLTVGRDLQAREVLSQSGPEGAYKLQLTLGSFFDTLYGSTTTFNYLAEGVSLTQQVVQAEFLASLLLYVPVEVDSIQLYNTTEEGRVLLSSVPLTDLKMKGGANFNMELEEARSQWSVGAGEGEGRFDDCELADAGVLRSLNLIPSRDTFGNFLLMQGNCVQLQSLINGLQLLNICKPRCTEDELKAFAHYANRVRDALFQLAAQVNATRAKYIALAEEYKHKIETLVNTLAPYLEVADAMSVAAQYRYFSFATGIYNPRKSGSELLTLTVTPSTGMIYVPSTSVLRYDGTSRSLPSPGFQSQLVECLSSLEHDFVYRVNTSAYPQFSNGRVIARATEEEAIRPGGAYKQHIIAPSGIYFHLKYKKQWNQLLNKYHFLFTVDVADAKSSTTSSNLRFTCNLPTGFSLVGPEYRVTVNNATVDMPIGGNPSRLLFEHPTVNPVKKIQVVFAVYSNSATLTPGSAQAELRFLGSAFSSTIDLS